MYVLSLLCLNYLADSKTLAPSPASVLCRSMLKPSLGSGGDFFRVHVRTISTLLSALHFYVSPTHGPHTNTPKTGHNNTP